MKFTKTRDEYSYWGIPEHVHMSSYVSVLAIFRILTANMP